MCKLYLNKAVGEKNTPNSQTKGKLEILVTSWTLMFGNKFIRNPGDFQFFAFNKIKRVLNPVISW